MTAAETDPLPPRLPDENSTHAYLREIELPEAGPFALITLANSNARKPATFSPSSLRELGRMLQEVTQRADAGDFAGIGITGRGQTFAAGADLTALRELNDHESASILAGLGHDVFSVLSSASVPTFAFINGSAIGGGLEVALAADYRSVSSAAHRIALPEAFLGLIPGWGGVYRLPRLIGPANAVKVMIENPLSNNKALDGTAAHDLGIADSFFEPEDFLEQSLAWADRIIQGNAAEHQQLDARRADKAICSQADWDSSVAAGRAIVKLRTANATPAPGRLLDLLEDGQHLSQGESAEREVAALTELMCTPEFKDSVYALLDLLQRRAKNPVGFPNPGLSRPIRKVAIVGAGLMACQLALLFAKLLKVPVVLNDIDQTRVQNGVSRVHAEVDKLLARHRMTPEDAVNTKKLVTGSISKKTFADADFVIEAVFEELSVKKQVFAEVEAVVSEKCILATNTSSLSVAEMASDLLHPERLIGFHFFNPVAAMPLLEIIRSPKTGDEVTATAFVLGTALQKTPVLVRDSTAFVVNRVLLRLIGEVTDAFDEGTPAEVADNALKPFGLPMTPFELLTMVGLPVSLHVTKSLNATFGDRFRVSTNQQQLVDHGVTSLWANERNGARVIPANTLELLELGDSPSTSEELLRRVQDALAQEIGLMLEEGVVASAQDIDLCMIAGAGWPLHLGGITPYLDRSGASERANGRLFHAALYRET